MAKGGGGGRILKTLSSGFRDPSIIFNDPAKAGQIATNILTAGVATPGGILPAIAPPPAPTTPAVQPIPTQVDQGKVAEAVSQEQDNIRLRRGRMSTILAKIPGLLGAQTTGTLG
jgi:hypothetical protein